MYLSRTAVRGVLGVTFTIVALGAVDTAGTWLIQESALEAVREKSTIAGIKGWAELLADPLKQKDWEKVGRFASCALKDERIWRISVQDARGVERYHLTRPQLMAVGSPQQWAGLTDTLGETGSDRETPRPTIQIPILPAEPASGPERGASRVAPAVGFLVAELARTGEDPVVRSARQRLMVLGAVLLVGAGLLLWWIHNLHRGIGKLTSVANRLAKDGWAHPPNEKLPQSWKPLAEAIQGLGGEIAKRQQELERMDEEMEERLALHTQDLRNIAIRDPLTGMYNRRYLDEVLQQQAAEAARYGSGLSVLMIDLDDLKRINDLFGHQVGDQALLLLASTIGCQLRGADVAARYGGDEFAVILPHTTARRAEAIARRICEQYRSTCAEHMPQVEATLSIGAAGMEDGRVQSLDDLIRSADAALYRAKTNGKGRVARFEDLDRLRFATFQPTSTFGSGF